MASLFSILLLMVTLMCFRLSLTQEPKSVGGISTSHGSEFFFGFMRNFGGTGFTSLQLRIGTTFAQAEYVVESQTGIIQQGTVLRGLPVTIDISTDLQISSSDYVDREKGLHVFTTNDATIFIIAENFVPPYNHGVFVPYPCLTFETDTGYEYFVISTDVVDTPQSQVLLVGCENDTEFLIIPSQSINLPQDMQAADTTSVSSEAGSINNGSLHQMQTLLIRSGSDLTGTKIVSNKPLTVIAGHECASIPSHLAGCEPLAVQVPPSLTWGNTFLLSTFSGRETDSIIKFVAAEKTSVLVVCGLESADSISFSNVTTQQVSLLAGKSCFVGSTNPILLVQFATSGVDDGRGDPAITLISPVDQHVSNISFLAPPINDFSEVYLGVTVSADHFNRFSILLDQEIVDCDWNEIYNTSSANSSIVGYGCNSNITNKLDSVVSQYSMSHSDPEGVFSVIVYGFGTSGLGFAYLAGQEITAGFIGNTRIVINSGQSDAAIPFYDITGFPGVSELDRVEDGFSKPIIIPNGLLFGKDLVKTAFVNENGVISFEKQWEFSYPERFPTSYYWTRLGKAVAPFWSDNDIRKEGTVRYTTYCNISSQNQCRYNAEGQAILDEVNQFVQDNSADSNREPFVGNWMLIAQWDHVHPSPHGADDTGGIPPEELSMTNTYQAIIVSNVFHTSMVFTYICGDIQWSAVGANRNIAVVGYNDAGIRYFNHRLSGYSSVGDSLSCAVRLGKRRKRQTNAVASTLTMDIPTLIGKCLSMLEFDMSKHTTDQITMYASMLEPCPCTKGQADKDTARFARQNESPLCYVSMKRITTEPHTLTGRTEPIVQQCCYNDAGALITTESINAGSSLFQHPIRDPSSYKENGEGANFGDKAFKATCCNKNLTVPEINSGPEEDYCGRYFQQRPINFCVGYSPPGLAIGSGDPHYTTFDGVRYDFQGTGDFTLFETSPPSVTIQARLGKIILNSSPTWHILLAFGDSVAAFEVGKEPGLRVIQTRPGNPTEITNFLPLSQVWIDDNLLRQVELKQLVNPYNGYSLLANFFNSGISVKVNIYIGNNRNYLNFEVRVPKSLSPTLGLLGNMDSNRSIEFFERGSNTHIQYSPGTPPDRIVFNPLMTWEIGNEESLFEVPLRTKRQATDPLPTPIFYDELNFTADQRLFCENSPQCLYDLVVSDNTDVAQETLNSEKEANATIETINNFPPNISADTILRVMLGQESVLFLTVSDSIDNFTLMIEGDLLENSMLEETSIGSYTFHWTLEQVTNRPLVFVANDSRGASSLFTPTVEICACVNGGTCTLDGLITSNTTIVMNCLCTDAFDGRFCEEDRNGCSEIQCFQGVECMDIPAPGVGAVCGLCPSGYTRDSHKCYDIDECYINSTLCEQLCINTEGGYFCSCQDGYVLIEGTNQCQDIDECGVANDCQQICENTQGSYSCNCGEGFTLAPDGRNCTANVPCDGACSFGCAVIGDEEQCFCPIGFQLDTSNSTQCIDQDECSVSNPCEQICINNEGSYSCSCEMGQKLLLDGRSCADIDECFEAATQFSNLCDNDPNSYCNNTEGSYQCVCVPGYFLNNNGVCQRMAIEPPSIVTVLLPPLIIENSVKFISPTLNTNTFTPDLQQKFREVTARAVNYYCMLDSCTLMLPSGQIEMIRALTIGSENVAIPRSLITENENEELIITTYIQIDNNLLSQQHLELAIMQAEPMYKEAGFLFFVQPTIPVSPDNTKFIVGISIGAVSFGLIVLFLVVIITALACRCEQDADPFANLDKKDKGEDQTKKMNFKHRSLRHTKLNKNMDIHENVSYATTNVSLKHTKLNKNIDLHENVSYATTNDRYVTTDVSYVTVKEEHEYEVVKL